MAQQGEGRIGDRVDGGLVAGDQEQHRGGLQVCRCHVGGERAEYPGAGVAAFGLDQIGQVGAQVLARPLCLFLTVGAVGARIESGRQCVGPAVEAWFVLARHAQDLADGGDGKGVGEVLDDVDLVLALEGVEQLGDNLGQLSAQAVEEPGAVRRTERG